MRSSQISQEAIHFHLYSLGHVPKHIICINFKVLISAMAVRPAGT